MVGRENQLAHTLVPLALAVTLVKSKMPGGGAGCHGSERDGYVHRGHSAHLGVFG